MNGYDYGAYLLFEDVPVFIDSRADLYAKEFNPDTTVFDDAIALAQMTGIENNDLEGLMEKYSISHVLTQEISALNTVLRQMDNYTIVYEDSNFVIFERTQRTAA